MNADIRFRPVRRALAALLAGLACAGVHAQTAADPQPQKSEFPYVVADPLHARPAVLDRGAVLPGDADAIECAGAADLSKPIALADAIDLAMCHSPQVQAAWAAVKVQVAAVGEARSEYLPTASLTTSELHNRVTYPDSPGADTSQFGHATYANVSWRLFDFGARAAHNVSAARLLDAAMASHDAAIQKTLASVVAAYFDAVTAEATVAARAEDRQFQQQTLDSAQRRESHGEGGTSDTLQARTALAKAQLAEQRARGEHRKALAVLAYAVGVQAPDGLQLASEREVPQAEAVAALSQWMSEASDRHPAILAARAQLAAARAQVDAARAEGMPTLDATGEYDQNGYPNQGLASTRSNTTAVGLTLTIPLFEGFARTYKVRSAQAQVEQSEAQLQDTRLQVLSTVVKDHADAESALSDLSASMALLQTAQAGVDSARQRYDRGAGDILELLTALAAMADAKEERVRCLAEWRSARFRLLADAGVLGRGQLQ